MWNLQYLLNGFMQKCASARGLHLESLLHFMRSANTSVYRFIKLFRKVLCEIDCAKSLDSLTREVDEYFRSSPGKQACTIKSCVNLSDRTIWQYGVKPEMKFHRVSRRKGEESADQTAIDRTSRRWRVDVGRVIRRVIKLPGSLT